MKKTLTPEEEGKQKLRDIAEEAKKAEEADRLLEEEEKKKRKKKLRERAALVFLSYSKDIREEAMRTREAKQKAEQDFYLQYLSEERKKTEALLMGLQKHDEYVNDFFDSFESREPKEVQERRKALLNSVGMDKTAFHTIALSSALRNPEHSADAVNVLCGKPCTDKNRADALRRDALQSTDEILCAYRDGDSDELRKLLTENLKTGCREFAQAPDPVVALHWARHIGNVVSIMEHKALLSKDEKDTELMETAVGITAMGKMMESGYEAMLKMQNSMLNGTVIPPEESSLLQAKILLMQQIDDKRNSPAYRKLLTGGKAIEKRSPEENMKKVLDQLSKSSILQQMASMSPAERCFAFSDRESRKYLTDEAFKVKKQPLQESHKKENTGPEAGIPAGI